MWYSVNRTGEKDSDYGKITTIIKKTKKNNLHLMAVSETVTSIIESSVQLTVSLIIFL